MIFERITLFGSFSLEGSSTGQKILPQKARTCNSYREISHLKRLKNDGRIAYFSLGGKGEGGGRGMGVCRGGGGRCVRFEPPPDVYSR